MLQFVHNDLTVLVKHPPAKGLVPELTKPQGLILTPDGKLQNTVLKLSQDKGDTSFSEEMLTSLYFA